MTILYKEFVQNLCNTFDYYFSSVSQLVEIKIRLSEEELKTIGTMSASPEKYEKALATDECNICFDSFQTLKKRKRVVVRLDCGHEYCRVCLRKHAQASIDNWKPPECPDPCCSSSSLTPIQGIMAQKKIRIMEKTKHDILKGRRQCPILNCGGDVGLFHDKLRCMKCQTEICSACEREKPIDHTCKKDDLLSITKSRECRRCPTCRAPFVKISGCPNMRCEVCKNAFTYTDQHVVTGIGDFSSNLPVPHPELHPDNSEFYRAVSNDTSLFICSSCSSSCASSIGPYCCLCLTLLFEQDIQLICSICIHTAAEQDFF